MTTAAATDSERLAALAALAIGQEPAPSSPAPALIVRTGREVYAGGDVRRLLVAPASLTYREAGRLLHADAAPGDVVLVEQSQADRLDDLGATADPDATEQELAEVKADAALPTDDVLRAMNAGELVAYVTQHPEERARVRELEEQRTGSGKGRGPRATVLAATTPTPDLDAEAVLLEDAHRQDLDAARVAGTPDEADPIVDVNRDRRTLVDPLASIGTPELNLPQ